MTPIANTFQAQARTRTSPAQTRARRSRHATGLMRGIRIRRDVPVDDRGLGSSYGPLSPLDTTDGGW
jgi:hypothetical protein